jgi:threonine/homoserine/homoserine lactone efflux protein
MNVPAELFVVLVLSILCGVLGVFLLAHKGVRMMRGGLLYRLSIGLAAVGIALSLAAAARVLALDPIFSDALQVVALLVLFFIGYSAWLSAHDLSGEA